MKPRPIQNTKTPRLCCPPVGDVVACHGTARPSHPTWNFLFCVPVPKMDKIQYKPQQKIYQFKQLREQQGETGRACICLPTLNQNSGVSAIGSQRRKIWQTWPGHMLAFHPTFCPSLWLLWSAMPAIASKKKCLCTNVFETMLGG